MIWVYIYLGLTVLSLIVEFITTELVSVWFAGGGLVALVLALLGVGWYVTIPVCIAVSFIFMLAFRKVIMAKFRKNIVRTNAESSIGESFSLLTDANEESAGTIKINGIVWEVKVKDNENLKKGDKVRLVGLEGNKYIVEEVK